MKTLIKEFLHLVDLTQGQLRSVAVLDLPSKVKTL